MKFTRTVKITRVRRERKLQADMPTRCPHCGKDLTAPVAPLDAGAQIIAKLVEGEKK